MKGQSLGTRATGEKKKIVTGGKKIGSVSKTEIERERDTKAERDCEMESE